MNRPAANTNSVIPDSNNFNEKQRLTTRFHDAHSQDLLGPTALKTASKKAGIEELRLHALLHTFNPRLCVSHILELFIITEPNHFECIECYDT